MALLSLFGGLFNLAQADLKIFFFRSHLMPQCNFSVGFRSEKVLPSLLQFAMLKALLGGLGLPDCQGSLRVGSDTGRRAKQREDESHWVDIAFH